MLLSTLGVILGDAFLVEPYAIEILRYSIHLEIREPLTLAHLSDLHTHGFGRRERRVAEELEQAQPDLIVVTGDVVDGGTLEPARELFNHLHAKLGVWVVRGNWENWRRPPEERRFYGSVGATLLLNEGRLARPDVWLAGVDDAISGHADMMAAFQGAPSDVVKIALFHSPSYSDQIAPKIDLAFAGHTHGGQVRLPFMGPLWLPFGSGRFVEGWYTNGDARLFVSRGVGTSILGARFLCRPAVALVSLLPN
jgi:predicted MPP superfamily phosphohydrolase